jgi:hypothetical protein
VVALHCLRFNARGGGGDILDAYRL